MNGKWFVCLVTLFSIMATLASACAGPSPAPAAAATSKPSTPVAASASNAAPAANPAASAVSKPQAERKPIGTLIVQQPSLRGWPMIAELGGAGLNVYNNLLYDRFTILSRDDAKNQYVMQPSLATKWESSSDFKTWTFELRKGVQWHDGYGEFTADDVKYMIDKIVKNPQLAFGSAGTIFLSRVVDSVDVVDPYKVVFHLNTGYGIFDTLLSDLWANAPVSKKYLETVGIDQANKKAVGTGPYKFGELKIGEYLRLDALDQHWRQVPYYKNIIFKEVAEPATAEAMLKTGDADIIVGPVTMKDEITQAGFEARINPGTEYTWAAFNGLWDANLYPKETDAKVPWRDIKVREAMDLAIDRQAIAKSLYKGVVEPAPAVLFMPGVSGYNPDLKVYPYDPVKAKSLLAEAGFPNGFEANMLIYPWTHAPEVPDLGQALAMYWDKIGIKSRMSWGEWANAVSVSTSRKDPRLIVPGGFTRMATPEVHLDIFFNPKGQFAINAPDVWALSQQMQVEGDPGKRDAIGRTIAAKIYDGHWIVPVAWSVMPYYVNPKKVGDWPFLKGEPYMMRLEYLKQPGS